MSETTKTMTFVAVALVALCAGWMTRPSSAKLDVKTLVGETLAKNFTDPGEAKRLRVVKFDEDTATLRDFEVADRRRASALGDLHGVSDMIYVPVRDENEIGLYVAGLDRRDGRVVQERIDNNVVIAGGDGKARVTKPGNFSHRVQFSGFSVRFQ